MSLSRTVLILCILPIPASAVDFKKDIQPILEKNCYECHSEKKKKRKGGFVFDELETFKLDIADKQACGESLPGGHCRSKPRPAHAPGRPAFLRRHQEADGLDQGGGHV